MMRVNLETGEVFSSESAAPAGTVTYEYVPVLSVPDGKKHGGIIPTGDGRYTTELVDTTAADIPYVESISPWQCRKWLNTNGLRGAVESAIPQMGQDAIDGWEYATEIRQDSPLVANMVQLLGMTELQQRAMFWEAVQL